EVPWPRNQWGTGDVSCRIGETALPRNDRGQAKHAMVALVIEPADLLRHPLTELLQGQAGLAFAVVVPPFPDVAESGARQEMGNFHERADQPLDVTSVVRCPDRAPRQVDLVFVAASLQRHAAEVFSVIDQNPSRL